MASGNHTPQVTKNYRETFTSDDFAQDHENYSQHGSQVDAKYMGTATDQSEMRVLGRKQELRRNFRFISVLGFGCALIGTWEFILTLISFGLTDGGTAGLIYGFIICMAGFTMVYLRRQPPEGLDPANIDQLYANPSVSLLSQQIAKPGSHTATVTDNPQRIREDTLAPMLHTYEAQIDEMSTTSTQNGHDQKRVAEAQVVVLTGSTGAVGSFILDKLIQEKSVAHVYCLNRASDSKSVQQARNTNRGLPTAFCEDKVTFLTADLSTSSLGLETTVLEKIRSSTTRIIHNAWPVDFNRAISSFKSSLDGVMGLISFAQQCKLAPSILFLSSISSMINYGVTSDALDQVPETTIRNFACPAAMGYGESKYLAERMLDYASQKLGQKTSVVRVGQIAGTVERPRGWSRDEWLPSLVLSSQYIGALPASLGSSGVMDEIDWIPIDLLAKILIEFTAADPEGGDQEPHTARVLHAVNTYPTTWETMLPSVKLALQAASPAQSPEIETLPYAEWLDLLRTRSIAMAGADDAVVDPKMIQQNPGVKVLDFYAGLQGEQRRARLSTEQSVRASKSLRGLEPIREEWLVSWIKNWVSDSKY